jgi:serine/threonine protein kinase/tetratricopeptide (TPR) repeat protein
LVTGVRDPNRDTAGTGARPGTSPEQGGPLIIGQAFGGRYHIVRLLGLGGMGAVYQAWDDALAVVVALKVIRPEIAGDPEAAQAIERRFKQELLLARQVTHKNVVRIHDLGEIDGIKYITMPFINGEDLASILDREGPLPVPRVLKIGRSFISGLVAAHEAGIVHRDLKPANIMIDADGEALITDFGIARSTGAAASASADVMPRHGTHPGAIAAQTVLGAVVGTVGYMAPEQAKAEPVDQRADIYSTGLILYDMLGGRVRIERAENALAELMSRTTAAPPLLRTLNPDVPEAIEEIVNRCLQPDAAARYQTTAELVDALNRLDENGVPLPEPPHFLSSWRFRLGAAASVILIVAVTWATGLLFRPPPPVEHEAVPVLVADFANTTGDAAFNGLVEQSLGEGIEKASFITAYQRPMALRVARQINAGTKLTEDAARLVALREGIKVVLAGTIETRGTGYVLTARGIDPTGKVLFTSSANANSREGVLGAAGALSSDVRKALGDTQPTQDRENLSTGSLDAVSEYTKAQELSTAGNDEEAIVHYKRATERDPKFGRAWGGWALSATRLGQKEDVDRLWKQALANLAGMTDRERYRFMGVYYRQVTRNYDEAMNTYEALIKQYPADGHGLNNLANAYFDKLEFRQALDLGQRLLKIYPTSPLYRGNYALYAMYASDFDTATRVAQKLVDDKLAAYDTYLPLAMAAVVKGDNAAARAAYEEMKKTGAKGVSLAAAGLADLALYEGDSKTTLALSKAGVAEDQTGGNTTGLAGKQILVAEALALQGDANGAAATARQALSRDDSDGVQIPAAMFFLAGRATADATKISEELGNRPLEPRSRAWGKLITGQIALAQGKKTQAIDEFHQAIKLADLWLVRFTLGRAFLEAGAFAEALQEFDTCTKRRGEATSVFLDDVPSIRYLATVPYWTARAQEGLGLVPQAQENYRKFLSIRTKDSPDPLVKDARRRLGEK